MKAGNTGYRVSFQIIATLAICIGAVIALASLMEATVWAPLPLRDPGRLAVVLAAGPSAPNGGLLPERQYLSWRTQGLAPFSAFGVFSRNNPLQVKGINQPVSSALLTLGAFRALGVQPMLGRGFTAADVASEPLGLATASSPPEHAFISARLWREYFHADPRIVGRTLSADDMGYPERILIQGVMPGNFDFPYPYSGLAASPGSPDDMWILWRENTHYLAGTAAGPVLARLRPGWSLAAAQAAMAAAWSRAQQDDPAWRTSRILVAGFEQRAEGPAKRSMQLVFTALVLILLLACISLTNLIALAWARRRYDFSIRLAHGARLSRLACGWLLEILTLTCAGCALGAGFSYVFLRLLAVGIPRLGFSLPFLAPPRVDPRLFIPLAVFAIAASFAWTALLFAAEARVNVWQTLGRAAASSGVRTGALAALPVVAQTAVSTVLAVAAVAAVGGFLAKSGVNLGPRPGQVAVLRFSVPRHDPAYSNGEQLVALQRRYLRRLGAVPGVQDAALTAFVPPNQIPISIRALGRGTPGAALPATSKQIVSAGYFHLLGIPLLQGRKFQPGDSASDAPYAIVNAAFAAGLWPGQSAVGRQFQVSPPKGRTFTVIGVAGNFGGYWCAPQTPQFYVSAGQFPLVAVSLLVRSSLRPAAAAASAKAVLAQLDSSASLSAPTTLEKMWSSTVTRPRLQMLAMLFFALVAVLLAAQGIFAAVSLSVRARRRESAIRSMLGAPPGALIRALAGRTAALTGLGFVLACAALFLLQRELHARFALTPGFLWGVAVPAAAVIVAVVLLLASYPPLRHARRTAPMDVLREG